MLLCVYMCMYLMGLLLVNMTRKIQLVAIRQQDSEGDFGWIGRRGGQGEPLCHTNS